MDCSNCGEPVEPTDSYCAECGEPVPDTSKPSSQFKNANPNPPPSFREAFIPYFLPWGTNKLEQLRRMGGCPGCGEGSDLEFDSQSSVQSLIGNPTGEITCQKCGATLERSGSGFRVTNGPDDIEGQKLSISECKEYAESQRTDTPIKENLPPEERYNHITGDYYWDKAASDDKQWILAVILLIIPPIGAFFLAFLVSRSITTKTSVEEN